MTLYEDLNLVKLGLYDTVKIPAIGDGSCFFHSILLGVSEDYCNLSGRGKRIMAANLRRKLAEELSEEKYKNLSNGEFEKISKSLKKHIDLSMDGLKDVLDSRAFVGQELIELVSNELEIDIYIIDLDREDIYRLGDTKIYIKNRRSVIIGYSERSLHYDLIGLKDSNEVITLFDENHEIIKTLRKKSKA